MEAEELNMLFGNGVLILKMTNDYYKLIPIISQLCIYLFAWGPFLTTNSNTFFVQFLE